MDYMIPGTEWTGMDQITENIFLGDDISRSEYDCLEKAGIELIINVASTEGHFASPRVPVIHIPLIDGHGNSLSDFTAAVEELILHPDKKILIHCLAGVSRSPTVLACYLAKKLNKSFDDCMNFIAQKRPCVNPNPAMRKLGRQYLKEI